MNQQTNLSRSKRSSNNTFNRMKSRNRLRHGPSQMSVMSYDAYSSKASNQVNSNSNPKSLHNLSLMIRTHSLIQH